MKIELYDGSVALVSREDYSRLAKYKWYTFVDHHLVYACRYIFRTGKRKRIFMHRQILKSRKGQLTDHANGNGLDNRRRNIRKCTYPQNAFNRRKRIQHGGTVSEFKGVGFDKKKSLWKVMIYSEGKRIYVGRFKDERVAALAYNSAAKRLHGKFARLNTW